MNLKKSLAPVFFVLITGLAFAQNDAVARKRNSPVEPFRIIGNIYYVGAQDITSFLIWTPQGLILLDGGYAETAPMIQKNIEQLGFKIGDVHILLNSHAHMDHAGGLAFLKKLSGAKMIASEGDRPLLERWGHDPQFGDSLLFPAVHVDRVVHDGEIIELGGVALRAVLTPGHTPGCTTWTMSVTEDNKKYDVVFLCSVTAPDGYRLINNKAYPQIVSDYEHSFARLKHLPCDIFLGAHGSFFRLDEKIIRIKAGAHPNPFIDPEGYQWFLGAMEKEFREKLEEQRRAASALN